MNKKIAVKNVLFIVSFLLSTLNISLSAQLDKTTFKEIVEEYFSDVEPGADILVTKKGTTIFKSSIGFRDVEFNQKIQVNDIFRIASITKQFTAAAILKLVEQGKLSLEDNIGKYVEGLDVNPSPILIKHLLSHTSGVKNYTELQDWNSRTSISNLTTSDIVDIFKNEPLAFEPGEKFMYSNLGYYLLGHIIEDITGQSFAQYLDAAFFTPLSMLNTGYENQNNSMLHHIQGYSQQDESFINAENLDMKLAFAAGALVSTTEDLSKWNEAIFSNKVLSESSLILAHSKFKLNDGSEVPYGFGWEIGEIKDSKTVKHDGIINGFVSFGLYLPEEDVFVAVLTNCICTQYIEEVSSKLAALAIGDPYLTNRVANKKSELISYQGIYKSSTGEEQIIGFQDDQLYIYNKGSRKYPLTCTAKNEFILESSLTSFSFRKNDNQEVLSFQKEGFDYKTEWLKISSDVMPLESIEIDEVAFEKYIGKYQVKGAFTFEVYMEEDKMYGSVQGDKKEILPYETNKFFAIDSDIKLEFVRDSNDLISHVSLLLPNEMRGDRIE